MARVRSELSSQIENGFVSPDLESVSLLESALERFSPRSLPLPPRGLPQLFLPLLLLLLLELPAPAPFLSRE